MAEHLCISIHFLGDEFHGCADHGEPEWPPSPLRLFQALVASNARLGGDSQGALLWLEKQMPPIIVTPEKAAVQAYGYKTYVPDNVGDIVARAWGRGEDKDISGFRTEKHICPTRFSNGAGIHFLWPLNSDQEHPVDELAPVVRGVSQFGWGIDLAVADVAIVTAEEAANIGGERWHPSDRSGGQDLRVPMVGTLDDLQKRHRAFLNRISLDSNIFRPVPPLSQFAITTYRRASEMTHPPYAVFALRIPDDNRFAAFNPTRRGLHLTGMLRHTAEQTDFATALGWDSARVATFVLGHGETREDDTHRPVDGPRLVFLPLPSVEWQGATKGRTIGPIRRVLITASADIDKDEFDRMIRNFEGRELVDEGSGEVVAFLRRQSAGDRAIAGYFSKSSVWETVTPVILPGYDDPGKLRRRLNSGNLTVQEKANIVTKLEKRIDYLLRKALRQAGYPDKHIKHAHLQWRGSGFMPGVDLAKSYAVPDQHRRFRRLHVRIFWRNAQGNPIEISGPLCIGGGRFTGLGLFAPKQ